MALEIRSLITFRRSLFKLGILALIFNKYLISGLIQKGSRGDILLFSMAYSHSLAVGFLSLILLQPHRCFQLHIHDSNVFAQVRNREWLCDVPCNLSVVLYIAVASALCLEVIKLPHDQSLLTYE